MAKTYEEMMNEVLAEKRGSIDGIKQQIADRQNQNNNWHDKINMAPIAAFVDSMTGSRLAQSAKGPTPHEKNQMVIGKLQQALANQKDGYGDQALAYFRTKANMDNMKNQQEANADNRAFDRWYKRERLADADMDRGAKEKAAKAKRDAKANAPKEYKADQANAANYGKRMQQAEKIFGSLTDSGYDRASMGESIQSFIMPREFQDENLRKQEQAERNFINANLRRESGAAIAPSEFDSAEQQYFPRPGDTPDVLAYKKANRLQAIEGMRLGAAGAWNDIKFIDPLAQAEGLNKARDGFVRIKKGSEVIDVPREDLSEAMAEGYSKVE